MGNHLILAAGRGKYIYIERDMLRSEANIVQVRGKEREGKSRARRCVWLGGRGETRLPTVPGTR